jgi:hypothetical protein
MFSFCPVASSRRIPAAALGCSLIVLACPPLKAQEAAEQPVPAVIGEIKVPAPAPASGPSAERPANLPASAGPRSPGETIDAIAEAVAATAVEAATPKKEGDAAAEAPTVVPVLTTDPLVSPLEDPPVPVDLLSPEGGEPTPTESVVVNLINRLVERGVLTQADASELASQAKRDAAVASQNAAAAALVAADAAMATEEDIVVTHIPEPVKERLREEIRQDILADAASQPEVLVLPSGKDTVYLDDSNLPDWVKKTKISGDFRLRYEASRFPDGNDNTGSFPNFNRINNGDPFDVAGFEFSDQLNVDQNRNRFRMRARLFFETDLGEGFDVGLRTVTGNDINPVTPNQTLGNNFNKYSIWLDTAYLRWQSPTFDGHLSVVGGRFPNPFFKTSEMMWDNDLGFDGLAFSVASDLSENVRPFLTAGAFPIFNTAFNFPQNAPAKFESTDRYLYGAQGGADFVLSRNVGGKFGIGYHDFSGVQGELSEPFLPLTIRDAGSTDNLRPTFAQKGNTYMPLRDIISDPLNNFGTVNQWQYFGLASKFQILSYNGRLDLSQFEPFQVSLLGEYSVNTGYDEDEVSQIALNNRGPLQPDGSTGTFEGGNIAWNFGVQFGETELVNQGDWNALFGYRFVESDAVMDAFNDSNFGLGGTNVEGLTARSAVAIRPNIDLVLRWMGASEVAGPPLKYDVFQFDILATF